MESSLIALLAFVAALATGIRDGTAVIDGTARLEPLPVRYLCTRSIPPQCRPFAPLPVPNPER